MRLFVALPLGALLTVLIAACNGGGATPIVSSGRPEACSHLGQYVSVGGTAGFNALANPGLTRALLATGHVRLYEHGTAIAAAMPPPYAASNLANS